MSILKHHTLKYGVADDTTGDPPETGDFVTLGLIADESDAGDPEIQTDPFAGGMELAAGSTHQANWRVLGDGSTWMTALRELAMSDGESIWFRVYALNGVDYTEYGPGVVTSVFPIGRNADPRRSSVMVRASFSGDEPQDFLRNGSDPSS